jgi:archaellum component FlaC
VKTTLTQTIKQTLLDAANDPAELCAAMKKYSHSKGPLYLALAEATSVMSDKLMSLNLTCEQITQKYEEYHNKSVLLQNSVNAISRSIDDKEKEIESIDQALSGKKTVLDYVNKIAGLGFGPNELSRLHDLLNTIAAKQGIKPHNSVPTFFHYIDSYEKIISLDTEVKATQIAAAKAYAEMEQHMAEAKAAEAKTKVRKVSIDAAEKLLSHGVKEGDIPYWSRILDKAGLTPEKLTEILEQFSSLQSLIKDRQKQSTALKKEMGKLDKQVKALTSEREGLQTAIQIVRDEAIAKLCSFSETASAEIQNTGKETVANLRDLETKIKDFGDLREQLGDLKAEVTLARALRSNAPEEWKSVTPQEMLMLINRILLWVGISGFDPEVGPPESVHTNTLISSWTKVSLDKLLRWAAFALTTDKQYALDNAPLKFRKISQ